MSWTMCSNHRRHLVFNSEHTHNTMKPPSDVLILLNNLKGLYENSYWRVGSFKRLEDLEARIIHLFLMAQIDASPWVFSYTSDLDSVIFYKLWQVCHVSHFWSRLKQRLKVNNFRGRDFEQVLCVEKTWRCCCKFTESGFPCFHQNNDTEECKRCVGYKKDRTLEQICGF